MRTPRLRLFPEVPSELWIEKEGFDKHREPFKSSYLVDPLGRCWARIDHPLGDHILFMCVLFFPADDANFIGLHHAKGYASEAYQAYLQLIRDLRNEGGRKKAHVARKIASDVSRL